MNYGDSLPINSNWPKTNRVRLEKLTYPKICTRQFHHDSHHGQILGTDHFADIAVKVSDQAITKPSEASRNDNYHIRKV